MVFISFCYISRCYPSDKCHKSVFLSRLRVMNTNWPPLCGSSTGWAWQSWSPRWAWSCWTSGESLHHLLSSRKLKQTLNMFTGRLSRMRCWSCFPPLFPGSSWIPRNPWTPRHQGTQSEFVDLIKKICTFSCCERAVTHPTMLIDFVRRVSAVWMEPRETADLLAPRWSSQNLIIDWFEISVWRLAAIPVWLSRSWFLLYSLTGRAWCPWWERCPR